MGTSKKVEIGQKFENLTVKEYVGSVDYNNTYLCLCDCGKERKVALTHLLQKKVTNCGCMNFLSNFHGNRKYSPQEASFRAKVTNYKSLAKNRKIEFKLSTEEAVSLLKGNCEYCGKEPSNCFNSRKNNTSSKKNNYAATCSNDYEVLYNGIDRIDNTKGYTKENTVTCCTQCNTAKLNFTLEEFKTWIKNIYNKTIINENSGDFRHSHAA